MILPPAMSSIARALFGEPNKALSSQSELRFGSRGSVAFDLTRGVFTDFEAGESGGLLDAVIHAGQAKTRGQAAKWLQRRGWLAISVTHSRRAHNKAPIERESAATGTEAARKIWAQSTAIEGTLAERYLCARAIGGPWPDSLRFHTALWCAEAGRPLPAMIAAVTPLHAPRDVRAVQRTWLQEPSQKAGVPTPKKSLGPITGCGVILAPFVFRLVVAEGIETALSADEAWGTSAVATLGASNMAALILPGSVQDVLIAFDRDIAGTGERAARKLATRLHAEKRSVSLNPAPGSHKDWNEFAQARARESDLG